MSREKEFLRMEKFGRQELFEIFYLDLDGKITSMMTCMSMHKIEKIEC